MHRYHLQPTPGDLRAVELREDRVRVGEEDLRVQAVSRGPGHLRLHVDGRVTDCHFARVERTLHVWLDGRVWHFQIAEGAAAVAGAGAAPADHVASPMPGTVRKVLVAVGDEVEADARVLVMESMKMEVSLTAPRSGRISEISCAEGDLVDIGQVLLRLELPA